MHVIGTPNPIFNPAMNGNTASTIMSAPANHVQGFNPMLGNKGPINTWEEFYNHLLAIKQRLCEAAYGVTSLANELQALGLYSPEASILVDRFFVDTGAAIDKVNAISIQYGANNQGPATNPTDSNNIVFGCSEATEIFQTVLFASTDTVTRLNEIHMAAQLAAKQITNQA